MSDIKRSTLFGKLNPIAYRLIEAATIACKQRGNPYVELVHWIQQLVKSPGTDAHMLTGHFGCDRDKLFRDIQVTLDRLPRGATAVADFSPHLDESVERGWTYASLVQGCTQIRTGHVMLGILKTAGLRNVLLGISREFEKIHTDELLENFEALLAKSPETGLEPSTGQPVPGETSGAFTPAGKRESLKRFTTDITEKAAKGEIDPIIGRDVEIRQCLDILMRRRQNNPILAGEAGVGKTAIVEGLAYAVVNREVPPELKNVRLLALDMGALQAGASMKGEFEQRLRGVISEVQASTVPIVLFIDEAHTLMGADTGGAGDAANLLKPALARGTLRTIAATTWQEYKRHIEKDAALTRRFQIIKVEEPSEEQCISMMRKVAPNFEKHHKVRILDEAIEAAVRLSHRYITARQLPDKAVSLIDTACARVSLSLHSMPPEVADTRRRIEILETELMILAQEEATGITHRERKRNIEKQLATERTRDASLEKRWHSEKELVAKILELRDTLNKTPEEYPDADATPAKSRLEARTPSETNDTPKSPKKGPRPELRELTAQQKTLSRLQGESPMIFPQVDQYAIANVVADWTGIPVGRMVKNEVDRMLNLTATLEQRVLGQRSALETIVRRIQTSRAKLDNPARPVGVFMLVGPSGTGKTETALALAEALYGGEQKLININMSEFQEAHTVSTLKGSPPGYVGYGEGGVLTEAVRRQPYSVILLDEVEKAHQDVHKIFFQVFDKGFMEDAEGRFIDFKNSLILLTSNTSQDVIINMCKDPELMPNPDALEKALRLPLTKTFPDALLNRLVVVPYYPISAEVMRMIIELNLRRVTKRMHENYGTPFTYDDSVPQLIAKRCSELERGARMVESLITNVILPEIAQEILIRTSKKSPIKRVHVGTLNDNFTYKYE